MPTEYEIVLATPDCNLKGGGFGFEVVRFAEKLLGIKDEKLKIWIHMGATYSRFLCNKTN